MGWYTVYRGQQMFNFYHKFLNHDLPTAANQDFNETNIPKTQDTDNSICKRGKIEEYQKDGNNGRKF